MKITIVGPGAMGGLIAYYLSKTKEELFFLDKNKERAQATNERGFLIENSSGNSRIKVKSNSDPKEIGISDLVIICVKAYHTKEAILHAKPLIGNNTLVLTLQNGIGNIEMISEIAGADKVIGGITNHGATLIDTNHIRHAGKGETIIGRLDGKVPAQIRSIREVFNKAGIETRISKDIKGLLWSKLITNAGINALAAISRLPNGKLLEIEGTRRILRDAVTEATRIAKRKRIKLIYDDPLAKVEAVAEATSNNICSMLQDVLRKKRTEIDFINGVIVRLGQELGIPTPVNSLLVDLVKTIESSYSVVVDK